MISTSAYAETTHWKEVAPGILYTKKTNNTTNTLSQIHFFKIDLKQNVLKLAFAKDDLFPGESVKFLAERNHALVAVNGGFFAPLWKPIGLRIQNGQVKSSLHATSWWHIFYLKDNKPYIISEKEYKENSANNSNITFAVQGGPRLLNNGQIPHLKGGLEERTALGITRDGKIIIATTEHWPITTTNLARILEAPESKGGFNCIQALNLDGGESAQLYANVGDLHLDVKSLGLIADIVYVVGLK